MTSMKKNYLAALLALTMGATAIAGCGAKPSNGQTSGAAANDGSKTEAPGTNKGEASDSKKGESSGGEKVHITWYVGDNGSGAHQALVDAFNSSQDEIEVEWNVAPQKSDDNKQQLLTSLAAGSDEYDVIAMDCCWVADIASSGYLEPIDEYMMDAGMNVADFNPGAIQANTSNAKLYALPLYMDVASLCVRKDIVSEEDLKVLVSGDYDYKQLMEMAAKYAGEGGTETLSIYSNKLIFSQSNYGYGSAVVIGMFVCVAIIAFIYIKVLGADVISSKTS